MNRIDPSKRFSVGKLKPDLLASLLDKYSSRDPRVIVGPRVGEDAAVIDFGDTLLVAKADPITFAADEIGWYAVNINANDVATMGAKPRWFMPVVLLPEACTDAQMVESIFRQIHEACEELGIAVVGGHTEITYGLDRPILAGQMLGEAAREELITTAGAQIGDDVVLTKGIAIEGTAVIAREKTTELVERGVDPTAIARAQSLLKTPGISVVLDASIALQAGDVHSMHDPTEGGIATGLREVAQAAEVGLAIDGDAIPLLSETQILCRAFDLDPLGLLASGSLVLTCEPSQADPVIAALHQAGLTATRIGRVVQPDLGLTWNIGGETKPFPDFEVDEIARVFG